MLRSEWSRARQTNRVESDSRVQSTLYTTCMATLAKLASLPRSTGLKHCSGSPKPQHLFLPVSDSLSPSMKLCLFSPGLCHFTSSLKNVRYHPSFSLSLSPALPLPLPLPPFLSLLFLLPSKKLCVCLAQGYTTSPLHLKM